MHTKFPTSVMILGVVSNKGGVIQLRFLNQGVRINARGYIRAFETVVRPWMNDLAEERNYVFH